MPPGLAEAEAELGQCRVGDQALTSMDEYAELEKLSLVFVVLNCSEWSDKLDAVICVRLVWGYCKLCACVR